MGIKPSTEIPVIDKDSLSDPDKLFDYLTLVKQTVDAIAEKAQGVQTNIRSTTPATSDIDEGEFVPYVNGATVRIYTRIQGVIKYWNLT